MNKCIRCGKTSDDELYEDRESNIYYGEILCFDCVSMITFEWGMDKETQERIMKRIKDNNSCVKEFVVASNENLVNTLTNMEEMTGDFEEAFNLMKNNAEAMEMELGDDEE